MGFLVPALILPGRVVVPSMLALRVILWRIALS
jgi:hypothetical protein